MPSPVLADLMDANLTALGLIVRRAFNLPQIEQENRRLVANASEDKTVLGNLITGAPEIHIYHAPADMHRPASEMRPVLLSYVDVVVQGYLREFGEDGVARFFETTDGWDAPMRNDRANPLYPRHQVLSAEETALVDDWLGRLGIAPF